VRSDPFLLADEVWGVGFQTADRIASALGVGKDSPRRAEAGVLYCLGQLSQAGHVCFPRPELARSAAGFLDQDETSAEEAIARLLASGALVAEELDDGHDLVYRAEMLEA
jgi:exodeoxyribonuclease V alpha subunit